MLEPEQVAKLKVAVATPGWNDVIVPILRGRAVQAQNALALTRSERAEVFKGHDYDVEDDFLRAMMRDVAWLLKTISAEIEAHDHNRRLDELDGGNPPANP